MVWRSLKIAWFVRGMKLVRDKPVRASWHSSHPDHLRVYIW